MTVCNEDSCLISYVNSGNTMNSTTTNDYTSLGLLQPGKLCTNALLSVFKGDEENVNYFNGLWNVMQVVGNEDSLCGNGKCDPRDRSKQDYVRDWKVQVRVCPADWAGSSQLDGNSSVPDEMLYSVKQTVFGNDEDQLQHFDKGDPKLSGNAGEEKFPCGVDGCGQVFTSVASYELHYHHCHSYVCDACRRVFVSSFLLDIHLQENHDSYFSVLSPKIDMYRCLVESCERKFRSPELRKDHLVCTHKFPSSFSFHQPVKANKSKHTSKAAPNEVGHPNNVETLALQQDSSTAMEYENDIAVGGSASFARTEACNAQKEKEMSLQNKRVPSTIRFGRGSQRAFQQRRGRGGKRRNWYQTGVSMDTDTSVDIEAVDMNALEEALG